MMSAREKSLNLQKESMPTIYLDACCLNRPFDDQTIDRVRLESEAVLLILKRIESDEWEWVSSEVLEFEINQTPDSDRCILLAPKAAVQTFFLQPMIV
jgi:hypothetical protein